MVPIFNALKTEKKRKKLDPKNRCWQAPVLPHPLPVVVWIETINPATNCQSIHTHLTKNRKKKKPLKQRPGCQTLQQHLQFETRMKNLCIAQWIPMNARKWGKENPNLQNWSQNKHQPRNTCTIHRPNNYWHYLKWNYHKKKQTWPPKHEKTQWVEI